jgi:hypothetical protein
MPDTLIWAITSYKLLIYAAGFTYQKKPVKALATLLEDSGRREVYAYFTDESPLPETLIVGDRYVTWFLWDQFAPLMEMLREEGPVFVHVLQTAQGNFLAFATSEEPVGEDEGP